MEETPPSPESQSPPHTRQLGQSRALTIDTAIFRHHLDRWDASDEEKTEYLRIVWSIVLQFVDLGYGIHPLHMAEQETCGKTPEILAPGAFETDGMVELKGDPITGAFNASAGACNDRREREES